MKTQLFGTFSDVDQYPLWPYLSGWQMFASRARAQFKDNRMNGDEKRDACAPWLKREPDETSITWVKGEKRFDGKIHGLWESDRYYHYQCRYGADSDDLEWMRKTDCNYLKRILKEGQLKALEPDVYYLCLISALRNVDNVITKDFDIGTWWRTKVDLPNIIGRQLSLPARQR